MTGEGSNNAAPPGKANNGAKKRRLEVLEQKAAPKPKRLRPQGDSLRNNTSTGQATAKASARQKDGAGYPDDYQPLSAALCAGPVGAALKLPPSAAPGKKGRKDDIGVTEQVKWASGVAEDFSVDSSGAQLLLGNARPRSKPFARPQQHAGKLMSSTARKKAGLDLQKSEITADVTDTLHELWLQYASTLVGPQASAEELAALVKSRLDLHGCKLQVVESKNPMHVGLEGIVIKESTSGFHLATPISEQDGSQSVLLRVVPKHISAFCFDWPSTELSVRFAGLNRQK